MYEILNAYDHKFCIPINHSKNIEYPLIEWCSQFINFDSHFVDIGADVGYYSVFLSFLCKNVYMVNADRHFNITINLNKINNIIIHKDVLNIKDVSFVKITNYPLKNCIHMLQDNNYPPILFNDVKNCDYLTSLKYNVTQITGYSHMYLASENPLYKKTKTLEDYEDIILSNKSLRIRLNSLKNALPYMTPLPYIKKINLNCPMKMRLPNNPSIIKIKDGYLCNIRASNQTYEPIFYFIDGSNKYRSTHHLLTLDENFKIKKTVILKDKTDNFYYDSHVEGIDDIRLIDDKHFICSHYNFNKKNIVVQCLGTFNEHGDITSLKKLDGPDPNRHEKNWLPFYNNGLYVIYMIDPFILYKIGEKMIKIKEVKLTDKNLDLGGGSPPIPYKNGWLCTGHKMTKQTQYVHRFIWFNQDFTTIKYSKPFYFEIHGIEYNASICHSDEGLLMTYAVKECNSKLITVDYNIVDQYLNI